MLKQAIGNSMGIDSSSFLGKPCFYIFMNFYDEFMTERLSNDNLKLEFLSSMFINFIEKRFFSIFYCEDAPC